MLQVLLPLSLLLLCCLALRYSDAANADDMRA